MNFLKQGLVTTLILAATLVALSFPVGLLRTSTDHQWCGGSGKAASGCIERRRAERFGPFKAWGSNNHRPAGD